MTSQTKNSSQERVKAKWKPQRDEYFIELMINQLHFGWKKTNNGFTKQAWNNMMSEFNRKFGLKYDISQLKNRQTVLKKTYNLFKKLINQSGFSWNEARQIITAEDDVWDRYLSAHPEADSFRYKGCPGYSKLVILFEGMNAKRKQIPSDVLEDSDMNTGPLLSSDVPTPLASTPKLEDISKDSNSSSTPMPPQKNKRRKKRPSVSSSTSCPRKKARLNSGVMTAQVISDMALAHRSTMEALSKLGPNEKFSYEKCLVELQELEGLEDSEFTNAVRLLRDEKHAIAFMSLKGPCRLMWLKSECQEI